MSSFFKQLFPFMKVKKKKEFSYIIRGVDPNTIWSLVGELGDGSFGKVYKAERKTDSVLAAAKIIDVKDESELDDFMVEIDILSECKHKHVVGMYEAYYHENKLWVSNLENDLFSVLELERGLNEEQIRVVCKQMFECLHFLHTHKVIHRDLKAGNLLLTNEGNIKLADFGVSAKNKKTIQRRTTFIGTPYWMAPEVIVTETCKDDPYDYKADIWSAGVTLIELAEMQPPYHDMHPMRVLFKIPKADPPTLQFRNRWSKDFHDFLSLCVVKSPEMRSSAADLLEHPFIVNCIDNKPLKELYNEAKAVVIEEFEDLPEDKEKRDKEALKSAESTESLDESEELFIETGSKDLDKEKDEREESELEESTEKEKDSEKEDGTEEGDEDLKENAEVKKEESDENLLEKEEEIADKGETKEEQKSEEESNKEEGPLENQADAVEENIEVFDDKEVKEEKEKENLEEKEEEVEVKIEEAGERKDEGETESHGAEEKREEGQAETEEAVEKIEEDGETKEEVSESRGETDEKKEEVEEKLEERKEEPEVVTKDAEDKANDIEAKEEMEDEEEVTTEESKEEPTAEEVDAVIVFKDSNEPAKVTQKEGQQLADKYSTRLDNILDKLEEDEGESAGEVGEPSVPQDEEKPEEGEKQRDEETTTAQEEEKSDDAEETATKVEEKETEEKNDEDKDSEQTENKTELEDEQTLDADEKIPIPNGRENDKEPSNHSKEKPETTDGVEEKSFKTLKRIRKYEKDGKIVTETTSRVVDVSQDDYRNALMKEQQQRKVNLREMKILQREEQKQGILLMAKIRRQWEAQEQRFEQELQELVKKFEVDLDTSSRNQKKDIEKLEIAQNADLRTSSRKMKQDQEKDLKKFRENLKEELKFAKKEVDQLPRNLRKESWRKKRDEVEVSQRQAEHEFLAMQQAEFERFTKELVELHREKMYAMEMQFLKAKHTLKRDHEGDSWKIEQRQLQDRHQLARTQLKETFFLQRSQMLNRHQKEVEQHNRLTKLKEEEMKRRHEIERKRLPKIQREEIKSKTQQYRKSLRIDKRYSMDIERELMKEFELQERKKARSEYDKLLFRQEMEVEELRVSSESALKELQLLQNEKRHMLMESETMKLKERDEKHQTQLESWKAELGPRKKILEEEFAREEREQQLFYAGNISDYPISPVTSNKESEEEPGEIQMDGEKTPEDNLSSKSSSGST
ncbi:hypothetical protein pdam_00019136 [Pocillopora damicornis]|uniref:Protein kinase domain-containing protein n=1 Tax=Pocillopora damicornis TaxID=46731 RepID=A0A3M6U201_POCDA|nr:hypothetical protein pdam_00019136 [Pocillopora damicornis]